MKFILTQGNVVLEAYEAHDRQYLTFGHTVVRKTQVKAMGFTLEAAATDTELLDFMLGSSAMVEVAGLTHQVISRDDIKEVMQGGAK